MHKMHKCYAQNAETLCLNCGYAQTTETMGASMMQTWLIARRELHGRGIYACFGTLHAHVWPS